MDSFLKFEPDHCSVSGSNCCFFSCIQVFQEEGKVFCYSHFFKNITVCHDLHKSLVVSDSLQPHELQQARPPCQSPTPWVHPDSCPLHQWCHQAISSSVIPFSSCPQSFLASESFLMSQLFAWGGQSMEFQLQHHSFQRTPKTDLL